MELFSPRNLQEAIYLAKFQESLLKKSLWVENEQMKSDKGLDEFELPVETRINTSVNGVTGEIRRDENLNTLVIIKDLQKRATNNVILFFALM